MWEAASGLDAQPCLAEDAYRDAYQSGRIERCDLRWVLAAALGSRRLRGRRLCCGARPIEKPCERALAL